MNDLPEPIAELVDELAAIPDAVAVVLGGSRASGSDDTGSDWDLGLYYRSTIDLTTLETRGVVHPPGAWGRVMNGGAWLRCGGERVDVILRDLDTVVGATGQAAKAIFEEAHALSCEQRRWACNEKRLMEAAGLAELQRHFGEIPCDPSSLVQWVDLVADRLGVPKDEAAPWTAPS